MAHDRRSGMGPMAVDDCEGCSLGSPAHRQEASAAKEKGAAFSTRLQDQGIARRQGRGVFLQALIWGSSTG